MHALQALRFARNALDMLSINEFEHETRVPLSEASRHPLLRRPGKLLHRSAIERWRTKGCRGVVLETFKIGGTRYTTAEAIERFIERCSTPRATSETQTQGQIAKAHAQAERELAAAGV
jgi:hypothetical protein